MTIPGDPGQVLRNAAKRHQATVDAAKALSAEIAEKRAADAGKDATVEPDASSTQ